MAAWVGERMERYFERVDYRNPASGRIEEAILFYPEYFRTMGVRLMLHGGGTVKEKASYVAVLAPGTPRPRVVDLRQFATYAQAQEYAAGASNRRVVAVDPTRTCVPLEGLTRYQRVNDVIRETNGRKNAVRIFRRLRARGAPS